MDPTRLRDDPEQPGGLRNLLASSARDVATKAEVGQARARLAAVVGASALGLTLAGTAKASLATNLGLWIAAGAVVAGGAIGVRALTTDPAPEASQAAPSIQTAVPVQTAVPATAPAASSVESEIVVPESAPPDQAVASGSVSSPRVRPVTPAQEVRASPPAVESSATAAAEPAPIVPALPVANESQLLGGAQAALASDAARALHLTSQHRKLFPNGALTQEREVIEIDALYRLGRRPEAARRAEQFITRHPGSSYARRVRKLMAR